MTKTTVIIGAQSENHTVQYAKNHSSEQTCFCDKRVLLRDEQRFDQMITYKCVGGENKIQQKSQITTRTVWRNKLPHTSDLVLMVIETFYIPKILNF